MNLQTIWGFLKEVYQEWNDDKVPRLAAALAFYTIFSLAPFLVIVIAIAGLAFGQEAATNQIVTQIDGLVGREGAETVQDIIQRANQPRTGILATVIGILTLLWGATGVFGGLQDALNTIWGVQPRPDLGWKATLYTRATSFGVVLGTGFLLLVSLVLSAFLGALGGTLSSLLPNEAYTVFWQVVNFFIGLAITTALFAMIYKLLPDVDIVWSDVIVGAVITAVLFSIGRYLIGLYLGNSNFTDTYGASAAVIIILIWVNFATMLLLFGAEITYVYAKRYGSQIKPSAHAVPLTPEARADQGIPTEEDVQAALVAKERGGQQAGSQARS